MDNQDPKIVDADIVEEPAVASDVSQASILLNMESMIKSHISSMDKLSGEAGKYQDMLNAIFENDSTYQQHEEQAKETGRIKSATKQQLLKQPQAADLMEKVKNIKTEIKESQGALSDYLQEYHRMSGSKEIEGDDGEMREIVYTAKLVKKNSQFRP